MSTTTKNKVTDIVKAAREVAIRSNEPMSIDEIRNKFDAQFPFKIKKVGFTKKATVCIPIGQIVIVERDHMLFDGWYKIDYEDSRTPGNLKQWVLV